MAFLEKKPDGLLYYDNQFAKMQWKLTYVYSLGNFFTFSSLELQNSAGANAFCILTSNERSLEMDQVIKMSLKPNERYDLNS